MERGLRPTGACAGLLLALLLGVAAPGAETFTVATFNLENYLAAPTGHRPAKSAASQAQVQASLLALHPDVVALQEIGGTNELFALRAALRARQLDLPHWELVHGSDTNICVAVLSRFPIVARRPHTNDDFLLDGRRRRVSRGFVEVEIQVNPRYRFTLITAHLKSRRPVPDADEAELREAEARVLRKKIDARLAADPEANLIVLGDLNDVKDSRTLRTILGVGRAALLDTRPAERSSAATSAGAVPTTPRAITWTHYFGKEDVYSRIDYLLLSRGLAREWEPAGTYVLASPNWGLASDHRPLIARFVAEDR